MNLLPSKFQPPPARLELIHRNTLINRLDAGLLTEHGFSRKITLIAASAGAGKTTLAANWLRARKDKFAWISLDELDNDPHRFLTYLLGSLQEVDPNLGLATRAMLKNPQMPSPEQLIPTLIGDIAALGNTLILALDDLHIIQAPPIHEVLNFLLQYQPDNLHLVMITREDPPLPLARMRARGQLLEIRQDDLRFSRKEGALFLQDKMGIPLSQSDIESLVNRTEGWAVGLQLAALAMKDIHDVPAFIKSFTGSHRFILDYLMDEVLEGQRANIQDFCLQTSILDRLTAPLCDAVTGREDSDKLLNHLDTANLFLTPLDQTRTWFRYHRLFAELLRNRLRLQDEISEAVLHRKAGRWLAANNKVEAAVPHALAAEDWEQAAGLINEASDALLKRGEIATLLHWCRSLPEEIIQGNPQCCLTYAWPLLLQSQVDPAAALLKQAERIAGDDLTLLGEIVAAQAFLAQVNGDGPGLVAHSEKALALLPKDNLSTRSVVAVNLGLAYWHLGQLDEAQNALEEALYAGRETGNMYAAATAEVFLARSQAVRGHLHSAAKWLQSFLEYGIQAPITALVHLDLTTLYYEWNDLENARKHLEAGEEIANRGGNPEFQAAVYLLDARIQHARCDHARALAALQKAAALVSSGKVPDRTGDRIRALELELGFISPVDPKDFPKNVDAHPFYRYLGLVEARWRIAKGEFQQATKLLRDARDQAEKADWGYGMVVIDTLTALAAPCETLAVDHLTQALERAQPEGYLRTFVDVGPVLEPILKVAARQGRNPVYVGKILAAIQSDISETDHRVIPSAAKMIEPLTDREMEVLRLVAAGMTNRAIADQLIVSISTVKSHVHHICGKLAASNRTEAVARGRELGLV